MFTNNKNKLYVSYIVLLLHEKLQLSNSEVIVTLIVNILFIVSVCLNIPLIRQDDDKNRFSNASTNIAKQI